jgi:hypothetical protein
MTNDSGRDDKTVFIGLLCKDGSMRWETFISLLQACRDAIPGYTFIPGMEGGAGHAKCRNILAHICLTKTNAARALLCDSDVVFEVEDIKQILTNADKPVVLGTYPKKSLTLEWVQTGLGFALINVIAFELIRQKFPERNFFCDDPRYQGEMLHDWFCEGVIGLRRLNEDEYFLHNLSEVGVPVLCDTSLQLGHIGTVNYLELHKQMQRRAVK